MASERMRILIRKFELRSTAISSRCLPALGSPEMLQTAARAILGKRYGFCFPSPLGPPSFAKRLSECLAFLIHKGLAPVEGPLKSLIKAYI